MVKNTMILNLDLSDKDQILLELTLTALPDFATGIKMAKK